MEEDLRYLIIGLEDGWICPSPEANALYKALYEYFGEAYIKDKINNPPEKRFYYHNIFDIMTKK